MQPAQEHCQRINNIFYLNQDILLIPGMLFSRGSQW
ncbi:hypothetical protein SL51_05608 [Klebsiella pneumoniae]|nr:hypothetical protein SL51_05608 [Klebsiella pneumoniae]